VLANVLSFEVLADWTGTPAPRAFNQNSDNPYDTIPGGAFDSNNPGGRRIKSLRVTIRIHDPRMKQTRQNTWDFAM
jgi:hypothetical protein